MFTFSLPKAKHGNKIGNIRNVDRQTNRIRTLKADERKIGRKSSSPRKKTIPKHRLQLVKMTAPTRDVDDIINEKENPCNNMLHNRTMNVPDLIKSPVCCNSPENVPYIKKTLHVKSPKRLLRTPTFKTDFKRTPIRIAPKSIADWNL